MDTEEFEDIELEMYNDNECPICYKQLVNYIKLECKHHFCLTCYAGFIRNNHFKCPICRIVIKGINANLHLYNILNEDNESLLRENATLLFENRIISTRYFILEKKYGLVIITLLFIVLCIIIFITSKSQSDFKQIDQKNKNEDIIEIIRINYLYD